MPRHYVHLGQVFSKKGQDIHLHERLAATERHHEGGLCGVPAHADFDHRDLQALQVLILQALRVLTPCNVKVSMSPNGVAGG